MRAVAPLLRQVHPNWVKADGTAASIAFWPFPKDAGMLSVDDGENVTPEMSWRRFVSSAECASGGVWAFTVGEAAALGLVARPDPVPGNPDHVAVDFRPFPEKQQKAKAKILSGAANTRGCLFRAP